MDWTPFLWLVVALVPLLFMQRWIHRHLLGIAWLLSGDQEAAVRLYGLPLLPGVIVHELSHALMAVLLGVQVQRIRMWLPTRKGGRVRFGAVSVEEADPVRGSLIGLAPLLAGSGVVLLIGQRVFGMGELEAALRAGDWAAAADGLVAALHAPNGSFCAYLIFSVSNMMLPSRTDVQTWPPVLLFLALIGAVAYVTGLGPMLAAGLAKPVTVALRWLTAACVLTLVADLPFVALIALIERLLVRWRGWRIQY